jgi:hypothetical protein
MAKINIETDCGNSPRKLFLSKFNAAIGNCDKDFISNHVLDSIIWEISGLGNICGKEAYLTSLEKSAIWNAEELCIESIITHGRDAAVSGRIIHNQNKHFLFCDIYRFSSAGSSQIKNIRSFVAST